MPVFIARTRIPLPVDQVFAWHERPGAFERLSPPWDAPTLVERKGTIRDGDRLTMRIAVGPAHMTWVAVHRDFIPGRRFRDEQVEGPFRSWVHTHTFEPDGASTVIEDRIDWEPRLGFLGRALGSGLVEQQLAHMFTARRTTLAADLALHARLGAVKLRVAVTGASGLIGKALTAMLSTAGHSVTRLVRPGTPADPTAIGTQATWDPGTGAVDPAVFEGQDVVVHLGGESVAEGRWTDERKRRIRDSRVIPTTALATALARMATPPRALVCASAIGLYDGHTQTPVAEDAPGGEGFLPDIVRAWEAACEPARARGLRVVNARIGLVLTPAGGALAKLLPPFRAGVGGPVGDGLQGSSWIALDDVLGALVQAIADDTITGPMNVVGPAPVSNAVFSSTLGEVLGRPAFMPLPGAAIGLLFGEMGQTLLLQGPYVLPRVLEKAGYPFRFAALEPALRHLLGKFTPPALQARPDGAVTLAVA